LLLCPGQVSQHLLLAFANGNCAHHGLFQAGDG
jgi:hypothetical protein